MSISVRIIQESPIKLWGLSSRERLERMLSKAGINSVVSGDNPPEKGNSLLILRGDFLYDQRIIENMTSSTGIILEVKTPNGTRPVAAHVNAELADAVTAALSANLNSYPEGLKILQPEALAGAYLKRLRKFELPYLLPITEKNKKNLEKRLFDGSYKGVTDLVTKWLWPTPAQWFTGFCARFGIVPNHVTSISLILSILAGLLFYQGNYAWGLAAAWLMTFLDTVDGKLARVTLNYSSFGHIFDHAIDLIFPPIWYLAWAMSLRELPLVSVSLAIWIVMVGYIAGRLVEGVFKRYLESSGIFCWQPIDSCFRLITGRRNPNLILLTISLLFGRPDIGFLLVCLWTALSSLFLVFRLCFGFYTRTVTGPLRSWFLEVDPEVDDLTVFQRWFYRKPKAINCDDD